MSSNHLTLRHLIVSTASLVVGITVPEVVDLLFLDNYAGIVYPKPEQLPISFSFLFEITFVATRSALGFTYLKEGWTTIVWSVVEYILWQPVLFLIWFALGLDLVPSKDYS